MSPRVCPSPCPGARNVPFPLVLDSWRLKPEADLRAVFQAAGVDLIQPLVGSCGSGLTACVLALAVHKATGGKLVSAVEELVRACHNRPYSL